MKVKDLKPNPKNPRKITDEKVQALKAALTEFGDLGAIIWNRKTKRLVGGHQRAKVIDSKADVTIEKQYKKPTKTGTVAEGFIEFEGERLRYREVIWDETKEKAAAIAANKSAGDWDFASLSDWLRDIESFGFDLNLTMFDEAERSDILLPQVDPNFGPGDEDGQGQLDRKKPVTCPNCDHEFIP